MDLNTIAEDLFAKVRGRFPSVTIGDEDGNVTTEPKDARYFEFSFDKKNDDKISISLDEEDGVVVMYASDVTENEITKTKWYNFLKELRMFSKKRLLNFDVRNITKSNLEKRDYQYLAARNSGDSSMNESKLYGTSKLSYQDVDSARLVIKHTESVNTEIPTGRTRNIGAIYIESPEGERFKYPFKHLAGARAMARHVAEGGTTYDEFGGHIVDLSEELSKLRKFKNYMGRSKVMAESLAEYTGVINDRISTVKKRIESLQKPNFYKEAYETFEKPVFEEVPEDVKENWIDQLTIRQFNEELKDVFPYIYKLIGETTRAQELSPDDFMSEDDDPCWDDYKQVGMKKKGGKEVPNCVPKEEIELESIFDEMMGQWADKPTAEACDDDDEDVEEAGLDKMKKKFNKAMSWGNTSPEELKKRVRNMSDEELKSLAQKAGAPEGGPGSERGLQMKLINQELKRRYGVKPGKSVESEEPGEQQSPLSEFILSFYDRSTGSFPKGETAVLTMVEKDYGEHMIDPAKQFIENINKTFEQINSGRSPSFNIAEEGGDTVHAFVNNEKGPNNHPGVAIRALIPHPTAMHGFTRSVVEFWGSEEQMQSGETGMNGLTLRDIQEKGIEIHGSAEEAMQASKAEHGEEGGKGSDSHDEYNRIRQLAGL